MSVQYTPFGGVRYFIIARSSRVLAKLCGEDGITSPQKAPDPSPLTHFFLNLHFIEIQKKKKSMSQQ